MAELAGFFPPGIQYDIPYDTAPFVEVCIEKVLHTLLEAVGLVSVVMLLFLQSFRYTIIATLVVPIALRGTCAVLLATCFSRSLQRRGGHESVMTCRSRWSP